MKDINHINVIISLTTIHTRINDLHKVIVSLLQQSHQNFIIKLYLSKTPYLLDEGVIEVPDSLKVLLGDKFEIQYVENTGPYRKLIPCLLENWHNQSQVLVTVDDDVAYPKDFLSTLLVTNQFYDCPIAYRGRQIIKDSSGILPYSQWKKNNIAGRCFSKLPTGKDGILYKPCYFHENVLNINDAVLMSKTADDIWFKWHTLLNKKQSVLLFDNLSQSFESLNPNDTITLFDKFNKASAKDKGLNQNDAHITNMQQYMNDNFGFNPLTLW